MRNTFRFDFRLVGLAAGLVAFLIPIAIAATGAADELPIRNPESPRQAGEAPPLAVPLAIPEHGVSYARLTQGATPARGDGLVIGQLDTAQADMPEVEAFLPEQGQTDPSKISFAVLGNVRYQGQGGQVQVTTFRPSAAAAERSLLLGNTTVKLPDGSAAWLDGNRVAFVRDGLIIAVSGNVGIDRLLTLAASVVVR